MALLCAGVDNDRIKLVGRWRSDAMMRYLHTQAAPLMSPLAPLMVQHGTYALLPDNNVAPAAQPLLAPVPPAITEDPVPPVVLANEDDAGAVATAAAIIDTSATAPAAP